MNRKLAYHSRQVLLAMLLVADLAGAAALYASTIEEMAKECATGLPANGRVYVEVGKFICQNNGGTTLFSKMLREEAQASFSRTAPFWVVTTDRSGELVAAGEFQKTKISLPGTSADGLKLVQLDGLLKGTYEVRDGRIKVEFELAWTDGRPARSVSRWLNQDEQLLSATLPQIGGQMHDSTTRDRVLVHVLAHGFPPDLARTYPKAIQELKSRGYGFAIWKNIEELLSGDPRFELVMESRSETTRQLFESVLSGERKPADAGQKIGVIVLTSHFIKPEKVSRDEMIRWGKLTREDPHYPVQLRLEFYDFSQASWPAQGIDGYATIDGEDPLAGARKACEETVRSFLSQLDKPPAVRPRKTVKIASVANRTGERTFDDLSFYAHVKMAKVLEQTGRFNAVTDGFLETVANMFPQLQKVIYDYELGVNLLEIKDKTGVSVKIGPFSRASKESSAKVELQLRDLRSGTELKGIGLGKVNKSTTSVLVEINSETLRKKEGIWILDESDLGQAISEALQQAADGITRKL